MLRELRPRLLVFVPLTLVTGVVYPGVVTLVGQLAFPSEVDGSVIERDGQAVGSRLLGQPFSSPQYFWSRPSATGPMPYNGAVSSGSNQGPLNPRAGRGRRGAHRRAARSGSRQHAAGARRSRHRVRQRARSAHQRRRGRVPGGARRARAQPDRRPRSRALVREHTEGRTFGVLGEPRVNVLELNLALDARATR